MWDSTFKFDMNHWSHERKDWLILLQKTKKKLHIGKNYCTQDSKSTHWEKTINSSKKWKVIEMSIIKVLVA